MVKKAVLSKFFVLILVLVTAGFGRGRFVAEIASSLDLVSDGMDNVRQSSVIALKPIFSSEETCEQTYGFLPCTTTIVGNIFLILAYGFLMYQAAKLLSNGSELLLEILGPGIIGGLFLPILGALPDALLILVSGLSGSRETAQSQVLVGMGLLAGSTVMLLTLLWGSCVVVGKCDIEDSIARDSKDTKGLSLTGSGVTTDIWTCYASRMLVISVIPFIIVQLSQFLHSSSGRHLAVLITFIVSVALLVTYCLYQVFQPWIQRRRFAYAKHKHVISGILKYLKRHSLGRLLTDEGQPDTDVIKKLVHFILTIASVIGYIVFYGRGFSMLAVWRAHQLFKTIDLDSDGRLSASELSALIVGIHFDEIDLDKNDAVEKLLKEFDTTHDGFVDVNEFVIGISRWIKVATKSVALDGNTGPDTKKIFNDFHQQTKKEVLKDLSDEAVEAVENAKWISIKAALMLLVGTVIAAAFADPLVDAVDNFSTATSIPTFFISFIVLPVATNSSEAVSALIFASRKKQRSVSLTFSEIYGAATMNNILCLAVFLALVYVRQLSWDFSAEVLVILIVSLVMGLFGSFRTTFPLWTCSVAYVLYPFSLVLVYVLDYVLGWS